MHDITAHYAHKVQFRKAGEPLSSYEYYDNRVIGMPEIESLVVGAEDMRAAAEVVAKFAIALKNGDWGTAAANDSISDGYVNEITWPSKTTIKQEIKIGDLEWELVYDSEQRNYSLNRSAFDLKWADFMYFVREWNRFVSDMGRI